MQQVIASFGDAYRFLDLPDADTQLLPGVLWGRHEEALTPAFWIASAWMEGEVPAGRFRLGNTLAEEVTACLLGGHGAPAEVGLAAYSRVREALSAKNGEVLPEIEIFELLSRPLSVQGHPIRYRFARQRSHYLAGALEGLLHIDETALDDVSLRNVLCTLPGIGPKTASWIVRNRRASDRVAILDVHVVRACKIMQVFPARADPARHYAALEARFLSFCTGGGARASVMDAVMWATMRRLSGNFLQFMIDPRMPFGKASPKNTGEAMPCPEAAADPAMTIPHHQGQAAVPKAGARARRMIPA